MLSQQWSSDTLKDGIGLLTSQCVDAPMKLSDLDDLIKAT